MDFMRPLNDKMSEQSIGDSLPDDDSRRGYARQSIPVIPCRCEAPSYPPEPSFPVEKHNPIVRHPTRPRLSDILDNNREANVRAVWKNTQAAADRLPLPSGTYIARIMRGELTNAKSGTPGYKLTFSVLEGEHTGRHFWHDLWLTEAAMPMTKRDLNKLGVTDIEQLESPLPTGIRCKVQLVLRCNDDGTQYNRVRSFTVTGMDPDPHMDPDFAPGAAVESREGGAS